MSSTLRFHVRQRERARAAFMLETTSYPHWIVAAAAAALMLLTFACCLLTPAFLRQALTFTVARFVPDHLRFSPLGHWLYHFSSSSIAALFLFLISQLSTLLVMVLRQTCGMEEWSLSCLKQRIAQPLYDSTARVDGAHTHARRSNVR
jgi:flagellar biosynthesis protein FlhB